jgi:site-specific DNA-methyltransferase (adenine-specific)
MIVILNKSEVDILLEINKIYNMDCLEGMKYIEDKSIDLVITDPPYKLVQGGCTNKAVTLKGATNLKSGNVFSDNSIKFSDWIPEVYRVLKENSHCYIMCNDRNLKELLIESENAGFKLLNILVWKKKRHSPNRYYLKNAEFIVFLRKGKAKNINNMGTFQCLEIDNVENKLHPSEKPVKLMEIFICNSSKSGDTVLDPFMGSGTVAISAINTGRKYIGFEINEEYCHMAEQRIAEHNFSLVV